MATLMGMPSFTCGRFRIHSNSEPTVAPNANPGHHEAVKQQKYCQDDAHHLLLGSSGAFSWNQKHRTVRSPHYLHRDSSTGR
jgi:hypothetical protein